MPNRNELILANLIANRAETHPDLDVLTFENDDRPADIRTYSDLWKHGQQIAGSFRREAMERGDCFAILMHNHPEFVEAMIGASIAGLTFVPIDPRIRGENLIYMLTHAGCKGVICTDYTIDAVQEIKRAVPCLNWVWVLDSEGEEFQTEPLTRVRSMKSIFEESVPFLETVVKDPLEPMEIMYTSGTTGEPKGVVISHTRWGAVASWHGALGYRPDDRPYSGLSLTHGNAQLITLACSLKSGMRAVFSRKFTRSRLWSIVKKYNCTVFNLLGGMTTAIYSEPPSEMDSSNPVRYVISAGMPSDIWEHFERRFNVRILEFYAAVEGGLTIKQVDDGPIGSIGKPPAGMKVRLVDNYGADVPVGTRGEIIFQMADGTPPSVEYLHDPEASSKKVRGGWLRTGDIGHLDENGWLFFDFRAGGAIRHNGEFVNPSHIEKLLAESPLVADVFVYGVRSLSGSPGEKDVVAAIVPTDPGEWNVDRLVELCREQLEPNSVPRYVQVVEEIPKTVSEKPIERFLLQAFDERPENVYDSADIRTNRTFVAVSDAMDDDAMTEEGKTSM